MSDKDRKEWELTDEEIRAVVEALFIPGKQGPRHDQIYAAIATAAARKAMEWAEKALEETNHECNQLNDMTIHQRSLVENLASMCRRLSYALMRAGTSDTTVAQCVEFLKKHGLGGNIVRPAAIEKEKKL